VAEPLSPAGRQGCLQRFKGSNIQVVPGLLHPQQAAQRFHMAAFRDALRSLSSQLCYPAQQHQVALPLAVADTNPELFQQHLLPFLDSRSKRALNASCRVASKHVRPAVNTITFSASTVQLPTAVPDRDPALRYPAISTLRLDFSNSPFGSPQDFQLLCRVA
jgi:hypothetical protein